ncbi:MAG: amidohydrolase [Clostridia bacterium]|nr:amidohydrolase [Clostridia bacterium]
MLHINAESSCEEYETAAYILSQMSLLGLTPVWVREPVSAYFVFDTGKKGKTIAFRADIDALAVCEDEYNLKQKKTAVSKNKGVCHACGHDGHTAMLLTIARAIVECKDDLRGRFIFFFESGEEKGAMYDTSTQFVEILKELKPDVIWGMHMGSFMDCGKISVQAGPRMATSGRFEIEIKGRGGHGATPHLANNPLNAASEIAYHVQKSIPEKVAAGEIFSIAVTSIQGGQKWNIIPDTCLIKGTFRCCSQRVYDLVTEQMLSLVEAACQENGCTYEYLHKPGSDEFRPVVNNAFVSSVAEKALDKILPGARAEVPVWMASESFGKYQKIVPGVFAFIGIRNEELGSGAAHHNAKFDMDERALALGVCATLQFVSDFLYLD